MKLNLLLCGLFISALTMISIEVCATDIDYKVIPMPQKIEFVKNQKPFILNKKSVIYYTKGDEKLKESANYLSAYIYEMTSLKLAVKAGSSSRGINLTVDNKIDNQEGYIIDVGSKSIIVKGASEAGLFYAIQTLVKSITACKSNKIEMPAVRIEDYPRFEYRGVMLDVSRHFFGKEFIMKQIDAMAYYKLNRLHLHLTDAAGWRIEIKRYPRLTNFAAWRDIPIWKEWWNNGRLYMNEGEEGAYGGYYTQDDIRELVAYAEKHHITIIPEIEMPAHSEEVLTAYPELSCTHVPYKQADFCVGNEKTFEFLENVLREVMQLFPSEYIHIGGDEAGKLSWGDCELCRKRMTDENLKDKDELQSYLIHRIERFLNSNGRRLLGWDEILDGGLAPNATVMSWRGVDGGLKAIDTGHKAIMSPGEYCYIDSYQDAPYSQPEAIGGYLPLEKIYSYNPLPEDLSKEKQSLLYGVQANLWTEYIPTEQDVERMLYPRVLALAEVGWSEPSRKEYSEFRKRAINDVGFLQRKGYNAFDLKNEIGNRDEAKEPIEHLAVGKKVEYMPHGKYYKGYSAGGDKALVDGVRGGWSYSDRKWQGFIDSKGLDAVVDLGRVTKVNFIGADFMQICGPDVFMPSNVKISVSTDGKVYKVMKEINHDVVKDNIVSFKNFFWSGETEARYVRYQAKRGRFGGFIFTDEIVIK